MTSIKLPLGMDSFGEIRDGGFYYIDKTELIRELLAKPFKANLITRPRRFGKTLTMSMLECFFSIAQDSGSRFAGLKIAEDAVLCEAWMNQWPVISLTLKSVEGHDFATANERFKILMADLCKKYRFLETSGLADADDIALFKRIKAGQGTDAENCETLYLLTRMLTIHYGRQVIVLIDEYDVPLAAASESGYYPQMLDIIRAALGKAMKTNEFLKFAVVTGCLRVAKESIFTGLNNFVTDSITGDRFNEYIGFTQTDVDQILADTDFSTHAAEMKAWYDGYRFGLVDVYCPWDVLNHINALTDNACKKPMNYWGNTSHNGIIYRFISRKDLQVTEKFELLMSGGQIRETITEELTYDTLHASEQNLWSLLLLTGYLTCADPSACDEPPEKDQVILRIPNEEVKSIFKTAIIDWFHESIKTEDRSGLFEALWDKNPKAAQEYMSDLLFETISYHDYRESYYHAFLTGLFAGAGYIVESNFEYGTGRPDIVVKDKKGRKVLIIEAKHAKTEDELSRKCQEAIDQIRDRKYREGVDKGYQEIIAYGIAFFEKECRVAVAP